MNNNQIQDSKSGIQNPAGIQFLGKITEN